MKQYLTLHQTSKKMILINNIQFSTQKFLGDYIRKIINEIGICNSLKENHINHYNFFISLFERHPDYPEKTHGLIDISITQNTSFRNLDINIVREGGAMEGISWKTCISDTKKNKFKIAMRVAIDEQISKYRSEHTNICAICKREDICDYHVDHEIHFEQLLYDFLEKIKMPIPSTFRTIEDNRRAFREEDNDFEKAWQEFHLKNAKLRILCATCNLKREKWDRITPTKKK